MTLGDRMRSLLGRARPSPSNAAAALPFQVGDRVADTWGNQGVVTEIDPSAEHGLGRIRLRYDDGRQLDHTVVAHDLKRVE